jgi:hypothetical protein
MQPGAGMTSYNHRNPDDLLALRTSLGTLTQTQKSLLWLSVVRMGLFKPLWPIRVSVWLVCTAVGGARGLGRLTSTLQRLPAGLLDAEWNLFLNFLVNGRNSEDPTAAGGMNRRDLQEFLHLARLVGWHPAEHTALP